MELLECLCNMIPELRVLARKTGKWQDMTCTLYFVLEMSHRSSPHLGMGMRPCIQKRVVCQMSYVHVFKSPCRPFQTGPYSSVPPPSAPAPKKSPGTQPPKKAAEKKQPEESSEDSSDESGESAELGVLLGVCEHAHMCREDHEQ